MQFLGKFGKIICWHPPEGWRSHLGEILDPLLVCSDLEPGLTTHNLFAHWVPCLITLLWSGSILETSFSSIPLVFLVSRDTLCPDDPVRMLVPPHTSAWYSLSTTVKRSNVCNLTVNKKPSCQKSQSLYHVQYNIFFWYAKHTILQNFQKINHIKLRQFWFNQDWRQWHAY